VTRRSPALGTLVPLAFLAFTLGCNGADGKGSTDVGDDDDTVGDDDDTTEPSTLEVFVNEVVAQNRTGLTDETGAFPDWVELYNAGADDVDLEGFWLTDDVADIYKWQFPAGVTLEAGGFLVIFCDEDTADGPLHASFNLGALDGEDVGLFGRNVDDNPEIDSLEDMALARPDTSFARVPDGGPTVEEDGTPTPGASND
jgi:hypothetical protein